VPTPGNAGSPASGPVNVHCGSRPVIRRLYDDGETTRKTPSASRLTCRTELPTEPRSSSIWSTVLSLATVWPCCRNGLGYSWLTKSRPLVGVLRADRQREEREVVVVVAEDQLAVVAAERVAVRMITSER
jgi:hypothetical protein